eukprot:7986325-Pyramimonas_sp.AAC.1
MATRHSHSSSSTDEWTDRTIVKIVILGTRAVLHMSGLGHEWWKEAMQAFCCGHNFVHVSAGVAALSDEHTDKTAHEIRF